MAGLKLKDGFNRIGNWHIFCKDGHAVYGFRVNPKPISEEQKRIEIREIIRSADELCGNNQGNAFLKTQINYEGK